MLIGLWNEAVTYEYKPGALFGEINMNWWKSIVAMFLETILNQGSGKKMSLRFSQSFKTENYYKKVSSKKKKNKSLTMCDIFWRKQKVTKTAWLLSFQLFPLMIFLNDLEPLRPDLITEGIQFNSSCVKDKSSYQRSQTCLLSGSVPTA